MKALSDEEVGALLSTVRGRAQAGQVVAKRDYALLLLYLATGLRRQEAIGLRGKDVHVGETLVLDIGRREGTTGAGKSESPG